MSQPALHPDLKGQSVLITGGGSGIGAALTEGFVAQGCKVAFMDIAEEASEALANRLEKTYDNRPLFLNVDLRDVDAIKAGTEQAAAAHGDIGVLVNNAAWDDRHPVEEVTEEYWNLNQSINLRPAFFSIQAVTAGMKKRGKGAVVNFTSTSFMLNQGNMPSYSAAKAGIIGLTKGLAGALGPHGIRVNAIAPGWVMTKRQKDLWATPETLKVNLDSQCLKEEIQPEDMVGPALFLASDSARMMTAQMMIVDGGYL